jgi:hypothetical protein
MPLYLPMWVASFGLNGRIPSASLQCLTSNSFLYFCASASNFQGGKYVPWVSVCRFRLYNDAQLVLDILSWSSRGARAQMSLQQQRVALRRTQHDCYCGRNLGVHAVGIPCTKTDPD